MQRIVLSLLLALGTAAAAQTAPSYDALMRQANPVVNLGLTEASGSIVDNMQGAAFTAVPGSGTIAYRQASSLPGRYAITLSGGATFRAPNATLGSYDWGNAFWTMMRVKVNVPRDGATHFVELFSKGHMSDSALDPLGLTNSNGGYAAYLRYDPANGTRACMVMRPFGDINSGTYSCSTDDIPNNTPVDLMFRYVTGGGSGIMIYQNAQITAGHTDSYGSPTGSSMVDASDPLVIGGDIDAMQTNAASPLTIEAFAMGSGSITAALLYGTNSLGRFWTQVLPTAGAGFASKAVIFDNDGCTDTDNTNMLAMLITLQKQRQIHLLLANNDSNGVDTSADLFRQMLDQAGMHHVPVSQSPGNSTAGTCSTTDLAAYNATYPAVSDSAYPSDVTAYRTALAAAPDGSVGILLGGAGLGIAHLLQSAADSISPLTGAQLFAQKVSGVWIMHGVNGGGNLDQDLASGQYLLAHNGSVPLYFLGDNFSLAGTGPGLVSQRASNDPLGLMITRLNQDGRASWDLWTTVCFVASSQYCSNGTNGTATLTSTSSGSFSTATSANHYDVATGGTWGTGYSQSPVVTGTFFNSLIQPHPEPTLLH